MLQRAELPSGNASFKRQRLLLGLSPSESAWLPTGRTSKAYGSIPDAWIYGDGFAILVESKVAGDFSHTQMCAHLARLRSDDVAEADVVLKTWRDIHRFFQQLLSTLSGVAALLVDQLIEYLEYSNLSGFTGFRREHFDYFLAHDDDEARRCIRAQVADFAHRLQTRLFELDPFYESYDVGTLQQSHTHCWAAFGHGNGGYRQVTHQSISLSFDGLTVFVNAELKQATDSIKAVLRESAGSVQHALKEMHRFAPFELVLEERIQRQASIYDYVPKMRLHSSLLSDENLGSAAWMAFVETLQRLSLPYIRIDRIVKPHTLLKLSTEGEDCATSHIAEMMRQNDPVVQLFNT